MNQVQGKKKLMDGYVGVKFRAIQCSEEVPPETSGFYTLFKRICDRLKVHDMTPANAGNLSIRYRDGLIITASGSNLGNFEENELIFVKKCRMEDELVLYHGPIKPSSESIMHWLIYKKRPEAAAVIHAHDEFATCSELLVGEIEESNREEPYGSVELANMAIEMFSRAEKIFVLKNHGYIAVGPDLDSTSDLVVDTHLRLLKKRGY